MKINDSIQVELTLTSGLLLGGITVGVVPRLVVMVVGEMGVWRMTCVDSGVDPCTR